MIIERIAVVVEDLEFLLHRPVDDLLGPPPGCQPPSPGPCGKHQLPVRRDGLEEALTDESPLLDPEAEEIADRRNDVEDGPVAGDAASRGDDAGRIKQSERTEPLLEQRHVMPLGAVLVEGLAVVADDDEQRILRPGPGSRTRP